MTGVSRTADSNGGVAVYLGLRKASYDVVAINPSVNEVEGDPTCPDLASVTVPIVRCALF